MASKRRKRRKLEAEDTLVPPLPGQLKQVPPDSLGAILEPQSVQEAIADYMDQVVVDFDPLILDISDLM